MARNKKKVEKKEVPKSSKGIKVDIVNKYLSTFENKEQVLAFTEGDKRPVILKAVEEALVKLAAKGDTPPKEEPPKEEPPKKTKTKGIREFKLIRKAHRAPTFDNGFRRVAGKKYVKGDTVEVSKDVSNSEIQRLFGDKKIWEEIK